jgi:hypothetical protein
MALIVRAGMPGPLSATVIALPLTTIEMTGAISASSQASSALSAQNCVGHFSICPISMRR